MAVFIVTGSYATESGNLGSFRYVIGSTDAAEAFTQAEERLKGDRHRKYMGKLSMSAFADPWRN